MFVLLDHLSLHVEFLWQLNELCLSVCLSICLSLSLSLSHTHTQMAIVCVGICLDVLLFCALTLAAVLGGRYVCSSVNRSTPDSSQSNQRLQSHATK